MNQKLIQQVEGGTHCIENNLAYGSEHRVSQVINKFTYDYWFVSLDCKFLWLTSGGWQTGGILPTGFTPINLDDFFKEEEMQKAKQTSVQILSKITGEEGVYLTHGMIRGSDALEAMEEYAAQQVANHTEKLSSSRHQENDKTYGACIKKGEG